MMNSINSDGLFCPVCDSKKLKSLEWTRKTGFLFYRCRQCGLVFLKDNYAYQQIYNDKYFKGDVYQDGYEHNKQYIKKLLFKLQNEINLKKRRKGRVLEVGCAFGYVLDYFERLGWETYGLDVSEYAITAAKQQCGAKLFCGNIEDWHVDIKYDLVILFDILEHLHDPKKALFNIFKMLNKGGIVYIHTYNFDSLNRIILNERWREYMPPSHCSLFNTRSIAGLLDKTGFKKEVIAT